MIDQNAIAQSQIWQWTSRGTGALYTAVQSIFNRARINSDPEETEHESSENPIQRNHNSNRTENPMNTNQSLDELFYSAQ